MHALIDQLEASLQSKQYFLSLYVALTVPDMAGALSSANGEANKQKYAAWYDQWVPQQIGIRRAKQFGELPPAPPSRTLFSGEECYRFRCSLLHQGRTQHPKSQFTRVIFIEPNSGSPMRVHNSVVNGALCIDLPYFCEEIIGAARDWLDQIDKDSYFEANYVRFARRHENGLLPYFSGAPVIG